MRLILPIIVVLASLSLSCGDDAPVQVHNPTGSDASLDSGPDLGADAATDATIDAATDAATDAGQNGDLTEDMGDVGSADTGQDMAEEPTWQCPAVPNTNCSAASPAATEHFIETADHCAFKLVPWSAAQIQTRSDLIDALVAKSDGVVDIAAVFGSLNRISISGITANNADRLKNHAWRGFRWNSGDNGVSYWYPQGVTGTSDAEAAGVVGGRTGMLVSWYHKTTETLQKGVRISLADTTDLNAVTYRHLLLMEPSGSLANPDFGPSLTASGGSLHAGGIVWFGDRLFVADTTGGIRVYDLSRIMRTKNSDTSLVGISAARFDGFGYGFVVPELMRFTLAADSCPIRFSFLGLDRSSNPPALVSGEYKSGDTTGRLAVWDLDETTGLLEVRSGESRATAAYVAGQTRMQGGVRFDGNLYISSSSQAGSFGRLYRTQPGYGESAISAWVYGAEDLYVERGQAEDIIWTAAEHPDNRDVVGIPIRPPP